MFKTCFLSSSTSFINVSVSAMDWLTVRDSRISCEKAGTTNVNFKEDIQTSCLLQTASFTSCTDLENMTLNLLAPWDQSVSHIGRTGDPDPRDLSQWAALMKANSDDIITVCPFFFVKSLNKLCNY